MNQWVPRGFAVVHSEASGTGQSQGCPTVGDYPERMAMKFVIDWLNGRAKGFTSKTGTDEVTATAWSTGKVGMIGTSYEGTLPLAAATLVPAVVSAQTASSQWSASLSGAQEVPATTSTARGTFNATIDETAGTESGRITSLNPKTAKK